MQVPLGVFAQAAGTALLPTLSAYAARNAVGDLRNGVSFGLRAVLAINIPASLFMVVMADPIVRTVYMSGKFTSADVGAASIALIFYSVGIFAWAGQAIVARGFFAMQDTWTPILLGTAATMIFVPLNYVLMRAMGHGGLALATSIAATIHLIALSIFLRKRLHGLEGGKIVSSLVKVCVATLAMTAVLYMLRLGMSQVISIESRKGAALLVLMGMGLASGVYVGLVRLFKVEEVEFVWSMIRRRFSKKPDDDEPPSPIEVMPSVD
jgi:putative peptidoglycan lipid II flippase